MFQLFTATPEKDSAWFPFVRFLHGLLAIGSIVGIVLLVLFTRLTIADLFASAVAFIASGWCVLCVSTSSFVCFDFLNAYIISVCYLLITQIQYSILELVFISVDVPPFPASTFFNKYIIDRAEECRPISSKYVNDSSVDNLINYSESLWNTRFDH